jgi:hypothetical protein
MLFLERKFHGWVNSILSVKESTCARRDDGCRHSNKSSASAPSLGSRDILDENDGLLGKELLEWWNWKVIAVYTN